MLATLEFALEFLLQHILVHWMDIRYPADVTTLIELRAGVQLPLIEDNTGVLNVFVAGSYQLNSSFSNFQDVAREIYPSTKTIAANNPIPISVSVGARYLFNW
jgi:hypothetical protein